MAHGLEVRVPFVDHVLLEAVWPDLGAHPSLLRNKRLLHETLARPLPRAAVDRPKQGFTLPFAKWMSGELQPFVRSGMAHLASSWLERPTIRVHTGALPLARDAELGEQAVDVGAHCKQLRAQVVDGRAERGKLADRDAVGRGRRFDRGRYLRCARQQMRPPRLTRSCLPRKLHDEPSTGAGFQLVQEAFDRRDVAEAMQPLGVDSKLARGLRPPQHEEGEDRDSLRRNLEDALHVVGVAHHAAAARLHDERQRLQLVDGRLHFVFARLDDGIAARLLVAAGDERVERERIRVRDRELLFDEDAQDPRLQQRKRW